jgi:hypothetical protein
MTPLTEQEIRTAFVNCTMSEAKRRSVPPDRAYLETELDGHPRAIAKAGKAGQHANSVGICMCSDLSCRRDRCRSCPVSTRRRREP